MGLWVIEEYSQGRTQSACRIGESVTEHRVWSKAAAFGLAVGADTGCTGGEPMGNKTSIGKAEIVVLVLSVVLLVAIAGAAGPWTKAGGVMPTDWPQWMSQFKDF